MRKPEKKATLPTATNSKTRFSQASSRRQTKLATLLVTNQIGGIIRSPIRAMVLPDQEEETEV
jgi:hypothetical protein